MDMDIFEIINTFKSLTPIRTNIKQIQMFSKAKQQQQIELNHLVSNPLYRKLFCPSHGFIYQYHCIFQNCQGFICGKIQCIDQHFHGTKLSIERFNVNPIVQKIKRIEELSHFSDTIIPVLNQLQSSVEQLKVMSANLFKQYKEFKITTDFLIENADYPLTLNYLQKMEELEVSKQGIQIQIRSISERINWKNIWITLQDQLQIIQKLKISFPILKCLYFQSYPLSNESMLTKQWRFDEQQKCEGIIMVYFTEDQYVIGKYISNNDVQTCQLFIQNFIFVVNQKGEIHQQITFKQILSIFKQEHSQYFIKINDQSICQRQQIGRQLIKKMVCFKAFME